MKKSLIYTVVAVVLLLTCAVGVANTFSYTSDKPEPAPVTEHKNTSSPDPATLFLFGTSMVGLLSFTKFRNL